MENKEQPNQDEHRVLTEEESAQAAGGFTHGHLSSYKCRKCGLELPDAGTYFEHQRLAHGE